MSVEGLIMFFVFFEFCVVKPKVILGSLHVVVEPLFCNQDEGWDAKVILVVLRSGGGGSRHGTKGGRATQRKKKLYDCTLGYPVEDVVTRPHCAGTDSTVRPAP